MLRVQVPKAGLPQFEALMQQARARKRTADTNSPTNDERETTGTLADESVSHDEEGRCGEQRFRDAERVAQGVEAIKDVDPQELSAFTSSGVSKRVVSVTRTSLAKDGMKVRHVKW